MTNLYKIGDLVVFGKQVAKVIGVVEDFYWGTNTAYYMYNISYGNCSATVPEPALSPLIASETLAGSGAEAFKTEYAGEFIEPVTTKSQKEVKCECGAYQIHWMQGQHAPYCPLGVSYA